MHLTDFCDWLNNRVGGEGTLPDIKAGDYGTAMRQSLWRHYAEDRQRSGVRMSNLGKPAIFLALAKLGYIEPEPKGKSRYIFHVGDMYENFIEVMLQLYGIEILQSQPELTWEGIKGHGDFIIKSPVTGEPLVVEVKTMSENYHRMFTRELNDDRGYITQLGLYMEATGLDGTWLTLNKGTNETTEIAPDRSLFQDSITRVRKVIRNLERVHTLDDVLTNFRPPPPRAEKYRKAETGRYLLHPSVSMSCFRSALYKLTDDVNDYGKPTKYVTDIADTEHLRKQLDFLVESGAVMKT